MTRVLSKTYRQDRGSGSRRLSVALAWCAVVAVAGCGSSSTHSNSASHGVSRDVKFSDCMRSHRVPNFPDLGTSSGYHLLGQMNQSAPAFVSAEKACAKYGDPLAPATDSESQLLELVKLAHCMRTHDVPNFPDPTGNNAATRQLAFQLGIDPRSPAFKHAAIACGNPGMWGS